MLHVGGTGQWRSWPPTALLLFIAVTQILLTRTADLSPWKGGGFGMFATTDGTAFRYVRLFVDAPERSDELAVPQSLEDAALRAQLFPSDRFLLRRLPQCVSDARAGRCHPYEWRSGKSSSAIPR